MHEFFYFILQSYVVEKESTDCFHVLYDPWLLVPFLWLKRNQLIVSIFYLELHFFVNIKCNERHEIALMLQMTLKAYILAMACVQVCFLSFGGNDEESYSLLGR